MRIMKFSVRKVHLLFMSLMTVAVLGHTGGPVVSIRAASPESSVAYHVRFGKEDFIRFYRCLLTFKTCLVTYTERYFQTQDSNFLLVRGDHRRLLQPGKPQHSPVTSFCTRTRTGEMSCTVEHHTDGYPRFGVRPLRSCDAQLCPCIYFYNAGHISYDSITVQDCPIQRLENTTSRLIRRRRASRSSSKSSSRSRSRSRTSSISSSSSNNSGGGGSGSPCAAMIAGITVGVIVFVGITLCIICYCVKKHGDNKKAKIDNTMAESPNDISEEIAAGNWNNGSDCPMPDVTNDTGVLKHDGADVCQQWTWCDDANKDNKEANVGDVNEAGGQNAKENPENWNNEVLELHN